MGMFEKSDDDEVNDLILKYKEKFLDNRGESKLNSHASKMMFRQKSIFSCEDLDSQLRTLKAEFRMVKEESNRVKTHNAQLLKEIKNNEKVI